MPMSFKTGAVKPPTKPKPTLSAKKAAKILKAGKRKTKEYDDSSIFGSSLFEPVMKKEREIIIKFKGEFTDEGLHFSVDGKFAYKLTFEAMDYDHEDLFTLFYFLNAIYDAPKDYVLVRNERIVVFENLTCQLMEERLIALYKEELKKEKEEHLKELQTKERLEQEVKDFNEAQNEIKEQTDGIQETNKPNVSGTIKPISNWKTIGSVTKTETSKEIPVQEKEEKVINVPEIQKPRIVGIGFKKF